MAGTEPRDAAVPARIPVWDLPVRLFHWSLVGLVGLSWVAADRGFMRVHLWSGSVLCALLVFRVAWGIVGSTTARFGSFIRSPRAVLRYLRGREGDRSAAYAGHNPAGGWMVVALLAFLGAQVVTGLFANDGLKFLGPLALHVSADTSDWLTTVHGWLFDVLLVLVYLHVVAVFFHLLVKRENLVAPMLTGRKLRQSVPEGFELRFARAPLAWGLLALAAGITAWIVRA